MYFPYLYESHYRYERVLIGGKVDEELNKRINAVNRAYYALVKKFREQKESSRKTKVAIYKSIYLPKLLFGEGQNWILSERQKKRLQAVEMKFL